MTSPQDKLLQLKNSTWITSGSRFNAEQRLRRQYTAQLWSIAILSSIAICVNILPLFTFPSDPVSFGNSCNFISIAISIAITSLSFYAANSSGAKNADIFHQCAKNMKSLNKDICLSIDNDSKYTPEDYKIRYDAAMDACPVNHETCDYMFFCAENSHDADITKKFPDIKKWTILYKIKYLAACYFPYIVSVMFLLLLVVATFNLPFSKIPQQ